MNTLKRHLSVANVLSVVAIFIALSATAVAATKLGAGQVKAVNIGKEAVTSEKIKGLSVTNPKLGKESVTSGKIKKLSVTNPKLGKESVTAGKIKKKAVGSAALAAESVTNGKLGPESISSTKLSSSLYKQLLKNVSYVTETSINDSVEEKSVTAFCPAGKEVIGGGARINSASTVNVALNQSYPATNANNSRIGWIATGREPVAEAGNWQVVAYVICAEL